MSRTLLRLLLKDGGGGGTPGPEGPEGPTGPEGPASTFEYVLIRDVKATNTPGGTFTSGAWRDRDLNTVVSDVSGLVVSLSSNTVTLAPGTWLIFASAPAGNGVVRHQTRLLNATATTVLAPGSSETQGGTTVTRSFVVGFITTTVNTAFRLQHQCSTTMADSGFGLAANFDEPEVYAVFEAWRLGA